ncbi:hypothetical protein NDA18_006643 [Ustilago nuda]|nr:hypothetical protein NDA18_006643 [Ustilago nuda]
MPSLAIADIACISERIKACCRRAQLLSTDEILLSAPQQLQQALRISQADLHLLLLQVATAAAPPPVSVLDALNGKLPDQLDPSLFDTDRDHVESSQESEQSNDDRLPPASFVPPTQGYDGNFPAAQRFVFDSDEYSDSDAEAQSDHSMHHHLEMPSTFPPRVIQRDVDMQGQEEHRADPGHVSIAATARDVLTLGRDRHVLTTGSRELDDLLRGGLRSSVLTEIVGESGSGKTQIAIQACTYAALGFAPLRESNDQQTPPSSPPSLDGELADDATLSDILQGYGMASWSDPKALHYGLGACYITSAGERGAHSIVNRALQFTHQSILERFYRVYPTIEAEGSQYILQREILLARALELGRDQVLRNLHVACVADIEALQHALKYSLPGLISRLAERSGKHAIRFAQTHVPCAEIGIVVVDNLPSLFQEDAVAGDIDSLVQRSRMLVEIAEALKRLAAVQHRGPPSDEIASAGRPVLVLNHVSDAFGIDKEIARRFVLDSADRVRLHRLQKQGAFPRTGTGQLPQSAYPDHPAAMHYATQSAFVTGLLASLPPTLAEAIGARSDDVGSGNHNNNNDGPLYVLSAKTAQLGHTWTNLINVRLYLSKTRGRVSMSPSASHSVREGAGIAESGYTSTGSVSMRVRKAAVVLNPFGPTMLDHEGGGRRTKAVQLRFLITPARAVHALAAYSITDASACVVSADVEGVALPTLALSADVAASSHVQRADADDGEQVCFARD